MNSRAIVRYCSFAFTFSRVAILGVFILGVNTREENQTVKCTCFRRSLSFQSCFGKVGPNLVYSRESSLLHHHCVRLREFYCSACLLTLKVNDHTKIIELLINFNKTKFRMIQRQLRNYPTKIFYLPQSPTSYSLCSASNEINNESTKRTHLKIIEYIIGMEPAHKNMWKLKICKQTFVFIDWFYQVNLAYPTITRAKFYYTEKNDNVCCIWCVRDWVNKDNLWRMHACFLSISPWLLRCRSRYFLRQVMQEIWTPENFVEINMLFVRKRLVQHGMLVLAIAVTL
jgi:hypothetical protein